MTFDGRESIAKGPGGGSGIRTGRLQTHFTRDGNSCTNLLLSRRRHLDERVDRGTRHHDARHPERRLSATAGNIESSARVRYSDTDGRVRGLWRNRRAERMLRGRRRRRRVGHGAIENGRKVCARARRSRFDNDVAVSPPNAFRFPATPRQHSHGH